MNLWLLNLLHINSQGLSPIIERVFVIRSIKNVIGKNGKISAERSNEAQKSQNDDFCIIRRARN